MGQGHLNRQIPRCGDQIGGQMLHPRDRLQSTHSTVAVLIHCTRYLWFNHKKIKWCYINDEGNKNGKKQQQKTTLYVQHTFLEHFLSCFVVVFHDCNVNLSSYIFYQAVYGGDGVCSHKNIVACVFVRFLFHCLLFSPYRPLTLLIFLTTI